MKLPKYINKIKVKRKIKISVEKKITEIQKKNRNINTLEIYKRTQGKHEKAERKIQKRKNGKRDKKTKHTKEQNEQMEKQKGKNTETKKIERETRK